MQRLLRWILGGVLVVVAGAVTAPGLGVRAREPSTPAKTLLAGPVSAGGLGRVASAVGCRGTLLRGSFTEVPGSRAMGEVEYTLRLRNTSSQACTVAGRPSLLLLDSSGRPLPTDVKPWEPSRAASAVTLWPGGNTTATALLRVDIPDGGGDVEQPGQPCQPTTVRVRVSAVGGTSTLLPVQPATAVCGGGTILLRPLVASEQQDYFHSPSGGVECELAVNAGKISALAGCQTGSPPRSVTMTSSGHLRICSGGDCLSNPPLNVPVLAYGHHTTLGPFRCLSLTGGVQCRVPSGRGFLIGRSGIAHL
jgi:hypothetical protein